MKQEELPIQDEIQMDEFPVGRCGMVALVGRANVGKSTLLNNILEEKVSIVSPVVQTTRNVLRGIRTEERGQLVFLDTPGVHKPLSPVGTMMNAMARQSIDGVDVVLLILDASTSPRKEDEGWMRRLLFEKMPVIGILNKQDLPHSHADEYKALWTQLQQEKEVEKEIAWNDLSALTGDGVDTLVDTLFSMMPDIPFLFPADVLTDFPKRWNISDVIREKYFHILREELPHALGICVDKIDEQEDRWSVKGTLYVNKHSQKGIVIGKKGRLFKKVMKEASEELESMYGKPVDLDFWVKIEKNWAENYWLLKKMGFK